MGVRRSRRRHHADPGEGRGVELGFVLPRPGQGRPVPRLDEQEGRTERPRDDRDPRPGGGMSTVGRRVTRRRRPETAGRRLSRRISGALILIAVATVWFGLFAPRFLGGPASYIMVAGTSMEPSLSTGDLVVARRQAWYREGDVVAYRIPEGEAGEGQVVIHQIVGGSARLGYILQGDNRDTPDLWRPHPDDIDGKMWLVIPGAGRAAVLLRTPFVFAVIAGLIAFKIALGEKDDVAPPPACRTSAATTNGLGRIRRHHGRVAPRSDRAALVHRPAHRARWGNGRLRSRRR